MSSPRFKKLVDDVKTHVKQISPAEAAAEQSNGAALIDVREDSEFAKQHAKGATHLCKGIVEWKIEETIPDINKPIVCYCGGGSRSALVADNLQKMGYTNVASMAGGFKAWQEAGLPTQS
jgi:rhodanese-related sulfurtransferase